MHPNTCMGTLRAQPPRCIKMTCKTLPGVHTTAQSAVFDVFTSVCINLPFLARTRKQKVTPAILELGTFGLQKYVPPQWCDRTVSSEICMLLV